MKDSVKQVISALFLQFLLIGFSLGQVETVGPITLPSTTRHIIYSDNIDQDFRLDVGLPAGYGSSDKEYPVVYMLDANSMFAFVRGTTLNLQSTTELPEFILVGIGYETENPYGFLGLRNRDYTPTYSQSETETRRNRLPPYNLPLDADTGGAQRFLEFIESEIKTFINDEYRTIEGDATLVGYSLGGLFASYVLFNHTDSFERYVVGSPSLWWDGNMPFKYEEQYAANNSDLDVSLYLSVGGREQELPQQQPDQMVSNVIKFAGILNSRSYPSLKFEHNIFEGETHISGMSGAINRGLIFVFSTE